MERKVQSLRARTVKMSGSPVRTARWPTISPGWVTNSRVSSSRSIMRWYTWSNPEMTNATLTSCRWSKKRKEEKTENQAMLISERKEQEIYGPQIYLKAWWSLSKGRFYLDVISDSKLLKIWSLVSSDAKVILLIPTPTQSAMRANMHHPTCSNVRWSLTHTARPTKGQSEVLPWCTQ